MTILDVDRLAPAPRTPLLVEAREQPQQGDEAEPLRHRPLAHQRPHLGRARPGQPVRLDRVVLGHLLPRLGRADLEALVRAAAERVEAREVPDPAHGPAGLLQRLARRGVLGALAGLDPPGRDLPPPGVGHDPVPPHEQDRPVVAADHARHGRRGLADGVVVVAGAVGVHDVEQGDPQPRAVVDVPLPPDLPAARAPRLRVGHGRAGPGARASPGPCGTRPPRAPGRRPRGRPARPPGPRGPRRRRRPGRPGGPGRPGPARPGPGGGPAAPARRRPGRPGRARARAAPATGPPRRRPRPVPPRARPSPRAARRGRPGSRRGRRRGGRPPTSPGRAPCRR